MESPEFPGGGHLGVLLTARCNLACTHCLPPRHFAHDLDIDLCGRILCDAAALGVRRVSFSGGEPALYPHLVAVVEATRDAGMAYSITTNGLILEPLLRAASAFRPAHVTISLDGADAASHDLVRGSGTFKRIVHNAWLLAAAGLKQRFQFTLVRPLIGRLASLRSLVRDLGGSEVVLVLPVPTEGLAASDSIPTLEELLDAKRWISSQSKAPHDPGITLALGDRILIESPSDAGAPTCGYLDGQQLFVDWNGKLGLCCQTSSVADTRTEVIADLRQVSLKGALEKRASWLSAFARARLEHRSPYACLMCTAALEKSPGEHPRVAAQRVQ